jgi:hypothetical protein
MHITDLPLLDYPRIPVALGSQWQTASVPAVLSLDVVWDGPVTQRVNVQSGTNGDPFAGEFAEEQATVTWSARNAAGFGFTANPGTLATTTIPGFAFAEIGHDRNGIFAQEDGAGSNVPEQAFAPSGLPSANGTVPPLPASLASSAVPPAASPSVVPALGSVLVGAWTGSRPLFSSEGGGPVSQALSTTTPLGSSANPASGYAGQGDEWQPAVVRAAARPAATTVLDQIFADLDRGHLPDAAGA